MGCGGRRRRLLPAACMGVHASAACTHVHCVCVCMQTVRAAHTALRLGRFFMVLGREPDSWFLLKSSACEAAGRRRGQRAGGGGGGGRARLARLRLLPRTEAAGVAATARPSQRGPSRPLRHQPSPPQPSPRRHLQAQHVAPRVGHCAAELVAAQVDALGRVERTPGGGQRAWGHGVVVARAVGWVCVCV